MPRPPKVVWGLAMAKLVATRATCARRSVGCVLVDHKHRVLATGYNGVASGLPHCNEGLPCPGAAAPSGTQLDACHALHAEQNALLQCMDTDAIEVCYCTTAPCVTCTKLLLNTECQTIWFIDSYPQAEASRELWESAGLEWEQLTPELNGVMLRTFHGLTFPA